MEMLRSSLIAEEGDDVDAFSADPSGENRSLGAPTAGGGRSPGASAGDGGSKCPFTGMVNDARASGDLEWTDEARDRMERIPSFVRPMVQRGIEDHARAKGLTRIDRDVLEAVRRDIGM